MRAIKRFFRTTKENWCAELKCGHILDVTDQNTPMKFVDLSGEPEDHYIGVKFECAHCDELGSEVLKTLQTVVSSKMTEIFSVAGMSGVEPSGRLQIVLNAIEDLKLDAIKQYLEHQMSESGH